MFYTSKIKTPFLLVIFGLTMVILVASCGSRSTPKRILAYKNITRGIQHGVIYREDGKYGGWPANNGIWCWGNEILVGFVVSDYKAIEGHTYDPKAATYKYARSKNGGRTWKIEDAYVHGQRGIAHDNYAIPSENVVSASLLKESMPDFTDPNFAITFQRYANGSGGASSHFYYSTNRGSKWNGPFIFPDPVPYGSAGRTDYIVDGKKELSVFITGTRKDLGGRVILTRTKDGGLTWETVSRIGPDPGGFDIMPSSVRFLPKELLTVIRSRTANKLDFLSSYASKDNGETWRRLKNPVADTGTKGSPPAFLKLKDGRLALAYIYRSEYGSRVNIRFSSDKGKKWSDEIVLRCCDGANWDVGYPRMVQREDGKLVLIYYWNNVNKKDAQPYRYIASTTVDPDMWKIK